MGTKQWFDYPTTRSYSGNANGGEVGIDVGTPEGTPIYFPFGGKITAATYGAPGGFIGALANIPGVGAATEYLLHVDRIAPGIQPGVEVLPGQLVGYSGGEVGGPTTADRHPASPALSGGPHTEFGIFRSTDVTNNHWWQAAAGTINPTGIISQLRSGQLTVGSGASAATGGVAADVGGNLPWWEQWLLGTPSGQTAKNIEQGQSPFDPNTWLGPLDQFAINAGLFMLALTVVGIGALLIFWDPIKEVTIKGVNAAKDAAKDAPVAAAVA